MKPYVAAATAALALVLCASAYAQQPGGAPPLMGLPAMPPAGPSFPSITPAMLHIPEGTKLSIRFEDSITSASAVVGDRFTISSVEAITLPDGQLLPSNLSGVGEVTAAHKKGMMGKAGELSVRLSYLKLGNARIPLRGSSGGSGAGSVGATVALTVLFGPIGLIKHGHDIEIPKGKVLEAFVDQDINVPLPPQAALAVNQ